MQYICKTEDICMFLLFFAQKESAKKDKILFYALISDKYLQNPAFQLSKKYFIT